MLKMPRFHSPKTDNLILGRTGPYSLSKTLSIDTRTRSAHVYCCGKTGKGKSFWLLNCITQDIRNGSYGVGVIDPHSDLVNDTFSILQTNGTFDDPAQRARVLYLNPANQDYIIPFNVLAGPGDPYSKAQNIIEAFRRTWPQSLSEAPQFTDIMLHSLLTLIHSKRSIIELPRLLTNKNFRDDLLQLAGQPELTSYFVDEYEQWKSNAALMRQSTLNKARAISMNPYLKLMLSQKTNALDFRAIIDQGIVMLADLGQCDEESQRLIGSLITVGMEQAAFSRRDVSPEQRPKFYLYLDEFHDVTAGEGSVRTLSKILSGARKMGLHLILAHQNLSQLSERMRGAIFGNVWTKVLFGVSEEDAYQFARMVALGSLDPTAIKNPANTDTQHPIFSSLPEQLSEWATTLANQSPQQAIVRDHQGHNTHIWTIPISPSHMAEGTIRQESLARWGIPYREAKSNLDEILNYAEPENWDDAPLYD